MQRHALLFVLTVLLAGLSQPVWATDIKADAAKPGAIHAPSTSIVFGKPKGEKTTPPAKESVENLMAPPECLEANGNQICGRLNHDTIQKVNKFGRCAILANKGNEDIFVPLHSEEELNAFLSHTKDAGVTILNCPASP